MYSQKKLLAQKMAEMNVLKQEDNTVEKLRKQIDDQLNRLRVCPLSWLPYLLAMFQSLISWFPYFQIEEGEIKDKIHQEEIRNVAQAQGTHTNSVPLNPYQKEILRLQEMKKLGSVASRTPTDLEEQLQNVGLSQLNLQVSDHGINTFSLEKTC